jgi:hypothetical protein
VLFHTLYKLRSKWRTSNTGELSIFTTCIKLYPINRVDSKAIEDIEPLAQYYLNWHNFTCADRAEVDALINGFWKKMLGAKPITPHSTKAIQEALNTLEFNRNIHPQTHGTGTGTGTHISLNQLTLAQLKSQYRKLQHRYHPDKGGSAEKVQAVLHAYELLCECLLSTPQ